MKKNELRALENADKILDSSILQHSLDILSRLLKKIDPESQEHNAVIDFPNFTPDSFGKLGHIPSFALNFYPSYIYCSDS
jgi:hypothetical protein